MITADLKSLINSSLTNEELLLEIPSICISIYFNHDKNLILIKDGKDTIRTQKYEESESPILYVTDEPFLIRKNCEVKIIDNKKTHLIF